MMICLWVVFGLVGLLVTDGLSDFRFVLRIWFGLVDWCACAVRFELAGCG